MVSVLLRAEVYETSPMVVRTKNRTVLVFLVVVAFLNTFLSASVKGNV